jgi:hypothetical protein
MSHIEVTIYDLCHEMDKYIVVAGDVVDERTCTRAIFDIYYGI